MKALHFLFGLIIITSLALPGNILAGSASADHVVSGAVKDGGVTTNNIVTTAVPPALPVYHSLSMMSITPNQGSEPSDSEPAWTSRKVLNGADALELNTLNDPSSLLMGSLPDSGQVATAPHSGLVMFIENVGQFDDRIRFQIRGGNASVYLAEDVIWLTVLEEPSAPDQPDEAAPLPTPEPGQEVKDESQPRRGVNLKFSFLGASSAPRLEPFNRLDTVVSYFIGDDPAQWQPDVPVWGGVRYPDLYPGVDLEMSGENGQWIWRLAARDGADLDSVRLQVEGADTVALDNLGRLRLETGVGHVSGPMITAAQGQRLMQMDIEGNSINFRPASQPDVEPNPSSLEPAAADDNPGELVYSTFLGGSSFDAGNAIAAGSDGTAYITGETYSTNFPTTPGAFDVITNGYSDIFVARLQSTGVAPVFSTFLGGFSHDQGYAIAVDSAGSVYVAGSSQSSNFPITTGAFDTSHNGFGDVVAVKLNATGNALLYSTFLGGASIDLGLGLAVDGAGGAYITGETWSSNFPVTPGAFDPSWNGLNDAFVAKLNTAGSALEYSTYLGGPSYERGNGIAIDSNSNAYVVGLTGSYNFPTTPGAFNKTFAGFNDVFITKLNQFGNNLMYSGLLGGDHDDQGEGIAVDEFGAAYVSGQTSSGDFTVTQGAYDTSRDGFWDGFVAKINPGGDTLTYSTYLGGSGDDCETGGVLRECVIAVDGFGVAYVAGRTRSANFPTTPNGFDTSYNGSEDGFMARLSPDGGSLIYGSFFGGTQSDQTLTVAVDTASSAYISGRTYSSNFPISAGAFDPGYNGVGDVFAIKLLVGGMTLNVQPTSVPADGVTTATVTLSGGPVGYQVRFISSRGPVDTFGDATGIVDSLGQFSTTIHSSTPGTSVLSVQDLTTGQLFPISAQVTFTGGDDTLPPVIGSVDSTGVHAQHPLDAGYLEGIPVSNRIEVTVDWKGAAPGHVDFVLNGVAYSESTSSSSAIHTFDMGYDLQAGRNHLRIVAYNAAGQASLPRDFSPYSVPAPVWLTGLQQAGLMSLPVLASGDVSGEASYEMGFHVPAHRFSIDAPGFGVPDGTTKLEWNFEGKLQIPLDCSSPLEGRLSLSADNAFRLLDTMEEGEFENQGRRV